MENQLSLVAGCLLLFCCVSVTLQDTVKVTLYYEALCPDSVAFINNQLVPSWHSLHKAIELDLVPYGFAKQWKQKGHWKFTCQHGPAECQANRLHACLIDSLYPKRVNKLITVLGCLMGNNDHLKALPACSKKVGLNPVKFIKCAKGNKSANLMAHYGDRTNSVQPKINYIPSIAFNDVFDPSVSQKAEKSFESVVCSYVPDECSRILHHLNVIEKDKGN